MFAFGTFWSGCVWSVVLICNVVFAVVFMPLGVLEFAFLTSCGAGAPLPPARTFHKFLDMASTKQNVLLDLTQKVSVGQW